MAAQKEACELRTRLQGLERAQRDTCRKLQEHHRQVRGPPPVQALQPTTYLPCPLSSCLTAILGVSFEPLPILWSDMGQSHSPSQSHN